MKNEQVDYSILKVFAILLVVFGHSNYTSMGSIFGGVDYSELYINGSIASKYINQVIANIYTFHMPLFIFISGALYYYVNIQLGKNYKFLGLVQNKFSRLLVPFFFVSLFYVVPIKLITGYFDISNLSKIIKYGIFLAMDAGHLWYVFMLFNLFVIFHLLEKVINKTNMFITILALFLVYWKCYEYLPDVFQIPIMVKYMIYFYVGYVFQKNKKGIQQLFEGKKLFFLAGTAIYFIVIGEYSKEYVFMASEIGTDIVRSLLVISVALLGILSLYLLASLKIMERITATRSYKILSKYSFGIYLLHDPINYVLLALFAKYNMFPLFNSGSVGTVLFVGLRFTITLLVPILILWFIDVVKRRVSVTKKNAVQHIPQ